VEDVTGVVLQMNECGTLERVTCIVQRFLINLIDYSGVQWCLIVEIGTRFIRHPILRISANLLHHL